MKHFLLIIIKCYWKIFPEEKRRKCIFKQSCSKHVFEITSEEGLFKGLKALFFRYKNCRGNFMIFTNPDNGKRQVILNSHAIVDSDELSERLFQ
ncbi:membrane protein insertion efficiency factor YidD [uncultured Flavobacterium sp.]|uniref:membrane protein insertion efficiency factor YidD n=1 Tax=uncultured Flavobacterium sp. TaxID=165435 RepID=UPI0025CF05CD|nr:membrane protein insertion efficiency factor YidD [uncultured Flavobacterium sp.]